MITPTIQEETYGARRNLVGQRPLRESHKSQSQSLPRILPQAWDLFIEDPTPYVGHPQFIQISPRGFYDVVKEWLWSLLIGHLPPKDGLKIDFIALNDLQLTKYDEYTFEDLPDPRLYGFDETEIVGLANEAKLCSHTIFGKHIRPTYLEYMYFQESDQVDQVRRRHRLLLTEDPL
jgi:hypothetical protein